MNSGHKPVRKCHDCELNLFDHCGIYDIPREMWRHRTCPGYKNQELLDTYNEIQARLQVNEHKQKRREVARARATEPHHQERLPLANR